MPQQNQHRIGKSLIAHPLELAQEPPDGKPALKNTDWTARALRTPSASADNCVKLSNGKGVCFIDNRFPLNKINIINLPMHSKKTSLKLAVVAFSALFSLIAAGSAKDPKPATTLPPASTQTGVTYAKDMKPIFEVSCVKCHQGDKPKKGIKMDTLEGVLKGNKHGPIVIPGNSAKSMLVESVAYLGSDSESWMPPLHNKAGIKQLTPEQIGLIRAWIDQGAK